MATMPIALVVLLLAVPTVLATNYKVGDTAGWDTNVNYEDWISGKTFIVGDTLEFNYGTNHKVDEVSESDYNSCTKTNPIKSNGGTTVTIELSNAGKRYFICPTSDHCANGMKLEVNVVASSSGTPPTTTSPPPPSSSSGGGSTSPPTSSTTYSPPPPSSPSGAWTTASACNINLIGVLVVFATLLLGIMA